LEVRAGVRVAFGMFGRGVASLVGVVCGAEQFFLQSAKKSRYEFNATVLRGTTREAAVFSVRSRKK